MSNNLSKDDVIKNKKQAIKSINNLLEMYINDSIDGHLKKANLIAYWLKDYVRFINFEENFNPTKNIAYKRGNIVKLNFGFNIGSEYGGLHYGIVLDKNNAHLSPVITVIPLTSIKDTENTHNNNVVLGNEIYRLLKLKYDTISKSLSAEENEISQTLSMIENLLKLVEETEPEDQNLNSIIEFQNLLEEKRKHNLEERIYLKKIGKEIAHMKEGSIALVNQISTVSKIRIFDPRTLKGVLSGITLSEESMEKINQKVKELYIF